jgi:endoglucanase
LFLAQVTEGVDRAYYLKPGEEYCRDIQKSSKALYTPGGLVYLDEWGPTRYALNSAFICILVSDLTSDSFAARRFHKWSQFKVNKFI